MQERKELRDLELKKLQMNHEIQMFKLKNNLIESNINAEIKRLTCKN